MIYRQIVQHIAIYSAYPVCIPFAEELFPTVIKITSYKNVYSYFSSWFFFFFFFFFFSMLKRFGGTHRIEWGRFHSRENLERYTYIVHTHALFIESSSSPFFPCSISSIRNEIFFFFQKDIRTRTDGQFRVRL